MLTFKVRIGQSETAIILTQRSLVKTNKLQEKAA